MSSAVPGQSVSSATAAVTTPDPAARLVDRRKCHVTYDTAQITDTRGPSDVERHTARS
jgi:hypothetical protein